MKMKNIKLVSFLIIAIGLTFIFFPLNSEGKKIINWKYDFALDRDFQFPSSPKDIGYFEVGEKTIVDEEWAMAVAKKLGFTDEAGNVIKPTIDYRYFAPNFETPSRKDQVARRKEQVDDEIRGDRSYQLPKQPEPVWPPKGAEQFVKLYNFQYKNMFLKINENNGAISFSNNDYLNFAGLPKGGLNIDDKQALEMSQSFIRGLGFSKMDWDPADSQPTYTNVTVNQATMKSGEILDSYICMKEVKYRRMLDGYPVVGGEGTIRMSIGVGAQGVAKIASFAKLARPLVQKDIAKEIVTASEAYGFLKEGVGLMNDKLRFVAEGTVMIKDAYLAYFAPPGYDDVSYMVPVWVFTGYDSKMPQNEVQYYINAEAQETTNTYLYIYTDKTSYTPNDVQEVGIEIYLQDAANVLLYVGLYSPDNYVYAFPTWNTGFFPIVANLPANFGIGPINFLKLEPITTGPFGAGTGHYVYFAILLDRTSGQLLCPVSLAEFDLTQ
jgi:hypothetical protein